jgi:eukaryotic-like serine/threonine-protein kinase
MKMVLRCPLNHEWDVIPSDLFPGSLYSLICPECGLETSDPQGRTTARLAIDPNVALTASPKRPTSGPHPALTNFPGYEVLSVLGRGAMGVVYKARQLGLDRMVALKVLPHGASADADALQRFSTEAKATAQLHHPNIVQIYDIGEQHGVPYFSLEFVDGGSLAQKLHGRAQPPRQAAMLLETLARAIAIAHNRGIIHRDLKPANVLLTAGGVPKITDFGLAKFLSEKTGFTLNGAVLGTPSYMAPEQARGDSKAVGPTVDIFSLGAILYEMLTGRTPFQGPTVLETMRKLVHEQPLPARRIRPELPPELEHIVMKCLEKEPADRYQSAAELADDLRRFLSGQLVLARPVGLLERSLRWVRHRSGE